MSSPPAPDVRALAGQHGVKVVDAIDRARFNLYTSRPVDPTPADPEAFRAPVSTAVTVETAAIETPYQVNVYVRDADGDHVATVDQTAGAALPRGAYSLECSSTPVKLYLRVESALSITPAEHGLEIEFPERTAVTIGARSFHTQPAGTMTVTDDPTDLAAALSALGASLKTTSPERSFPTLRGHPALVERGAALSVPDRDPAPGVRIEVPAEYRYLFPVASLAYYLDAAVEPGEEPRLVADGTAHSLTDRGGFERTVADVLRTTFLLDCVVRTTGLYRVDLAEAETVGPVLDEYLTASLADLYEAPLAERVDAYLTVPHEALADHLPDWHLTADVPPTAEKLPLVPHLVNDLAIVRCRSFSDGEVELGAGEEPEALNEFFRGGTSPGGRSGPPAPDPTGGAVVRGAAGTGTRAPRDQPADEPRPANVIEVDERASINYAWFGEDLPLNAARPTLSAYERRLDRHGEDATSNRIDVHVVVNDEEMLEEAAVGDIYGERDLLAFDITIHEHLTTEELADLLANSLDFLHFVGHVTADGMQCADGYLDVASLDEVGPAAFFINACRSYRQGRLLVENGAISGIVTMERVLNTSATDVGHSVARLLNVGWSMSSALSIVQDELIAGTSYMVMGDGTATIAQYDSGSPVAASVGSVGALDDADYTVPGEAEPTAGDYAVDLYVYPNSKQGLGSMYAPYVGDNERQYLNSGFIDRFAVTREELLAFVHSGSFPVRLSGQGFDWSRDVSREKLERLDLGAPRPLR